jgi:hypothetical protein
MRRTLKQLEEHEPRDILQPIFDAAVVVWALLIVFICVVIVNYDEYKKIQVQVMGERQAKARSIVYKGDLERWSHGSQEARSMDSE